MYIMVVLGFLGWIFLAIYGGIGLVALPGDFIGGYVNRPKVLKPEEAKAKKQEIEKQSSELVEMGETLKEEEEMLGKTDGWWDKRKQQGKVERLFQKFKESVVKLEEDYELFDAELKIQNQNPVVPVL
jgi:LMBR1 domain-containing protein 1